MRTVSFTSVVNGITARMGLDPTIAPASNTLAAIAEYVTSSVRSCQECYPWPDFEMIEQRQFYPTWSSSTSYGVGAVVLGSDLQYYIAVANTTGNDPTTDANDSWWMNASGFHCTLWSASVSYPDNVFVYAGDGNYYVSVNPSQGQNPTTDATDTYWVQVLSSNVNFNTGGIFYAIPLSQTMNGVALTPIGEVINVFASDPRTSRYAAPIPWMLTEDGIVAVQNQVSSPTVPSLVWVQYYTRPQTYTSANYNDGVTTVPYVIAEAVKNYALAMMHREDGQFDKANVMDQIGRSYLDVEWDKLEMKQSQQGRFQALQR
jgi:hypothetical protein